MVGVEPVEEEPIGLYTKLRKTRTFEMDVKQKILIGKLSNLVQLQLVACTNISSVGSPICQEGQTEKTSPIFAFSSRCFLFFPEFFPIFPSFSQFLANFSLSGVALCPLDPQWLCH